MAEMEELYLTREEIKFVKEYYRGLKEYAGDHGWHEYRKEDFDARSIR